MAPPQLLETGFALGATRLEMAGLLLRQALPGLCTALLLALGRGVGDAASVLFIAGYTDSCRCRSSTTWRMACVCKGATSARLRRSWRRSCAQSDCGRKSRIVSKRRRPGSQAGSNSGYAWRARWPSAPKSCSATNPPPRSIPFRRAALRSCSLRCHYTILMVTHDIDQARHLADYVVFPWMGELIEQAPAAEFFGAPRAELTQAYLSRRIG